MTDEKKSVTLIADGEKGNRHVNEVYARRAICKVAIRTIDREVSKDDPRRESAMEELKRQLAELDQEITELTGEPPAIVVGLQPGSLTAKSKIGQGDSNG